MFSSSGDLARVSDSKTDKAWVSSGLQHAAFRPLEKWQGDELLEPGESNGIFRGISTRNWMKLVAFRVFKRYSSETEKDE